MGAPKLLGVLTYRCHVAFELIRRLERCEVTVGKPRRTLECGVGTPADPYIDRARIVVGALQRSRLDRHILEVEVLAMEARFRLGPYLSQDKDSLVGAPTAPVRLGPACGVIRKGAPGSH